MKQVKKTITISSFLLVLCTLFLVAQNLPVKAASLFDGAVNWDPLKIVEQTEGTHYYQIIVPEKQYYKFHEYRPEIYNVLGEKIDYDYDEGQYTLDAGTYYAKFSGYAFSWYEMEKPNEKTNVENNITGTVFETYSVLKPLELVTVDDKAWTVENRVYKIVLTEPGKITFKEDDEHCGTSFFDNNGRELIGNSYGLNGESINLEAGTYWIRFGEWHGITNFYYILSNTDKATGISLSQPSATLKVGESIQLGYTLAPAKCEDKVTWSTGNSSVAKVDENGKVTAVAPGNCLIIGTTGSKKSASCQVTVTKSSVLLKAPAKSDFGIANTSISGTRMVWFSAQDKSGAASGYEIAVYKLKGNKKVFSTTSSNNGFAVKRNVSYKYRCRFYSTYGDTKIYSSWSGYRYFCFHTASGKKYSNKIKLKWKKISEAKNYTIYIKKSNGSFKKVKKVGKKTTSLTIRKCGSQRIKKNTAYQVKIVVDLKDGNKSVRSDLSFYAKTT